MLFFWYTVPAIQQVKCKFPQVTLSSVNGKRLTQKFHDIFYQSQRAARG
jgi:hypothetical protein